ncbi:MAG TPA: SAM-dependent methyltransferase [Terriglobales bacterium]|nr:SAM-dependent methyltransferase [Terriglobales bacterium]
MSSVSGDVTHVSDTALMTAACRAHETEQPDAFVRDPFAARLAGERGRAILEALPNSGLLRFGLAIRTRFIDELVLEVAPHLTTVLSVGAGLDTRPWRLDLPPDLRWIEVDFADILDYKDRLMSDEKPRCRRERFTVDMNDEAQRHAMYQAAGTSPALMITEGLLLYLPRATVEALALEVSKQSGVAHWITDVTTTAFDRAVRGGTDAIPAIRNMQPGDHLKGDELLEVLARNGWTTAQWRSYVTDVEFATERIRRMLGGTMPPPPPIPPNDPTGVHRFTITPDRL